MRLRVALAGLVAIVLIAASCTAAGCAVMCDLHGMPAQCHGMAEGRTGMMAGMAHDTAAEAVPPHGVASGCAQGRCVALPVQPGETVPLAFQNSPQLPPVAAFGGWLAVGSWLDGRHDVLLPPGSKPAVLPSVLRV